MHAVNYGPASQPAMASRRDGDVIFGSNIYAVKNMDISVPAE